MELQIISSDLLNECLSLVPQDLQVAFNNLHDAELSTPNFSFYISVASVFSSKIEGEAIELDSYIKHKRDGVAFQPDYTMKTDDLYSAYQFAKSEPLNEENIKHAHKLLSKHIVANSWQGRYRKQNMYVATEDGGIEFVAALPSNVPGEMEKLLEDISELLNASLTIAEVLYYASMIHLVFLKIHPWSDGNGRSARLIEKWFIASKLGAKAWFIQSEKMYYQQHQAYYKNIRALGLEYELLEFGLAMPFLLMLPKTLISG